MGEEKPEGVPTNRRRLAFCGRCVAVVSVLLLVPVVRRLREQRHERQQQHRHHHRRFPLVGH